MSARAHTFRMVAYDIWNFLWSRGPTCMRTSRDINHCNTHCGQFWDATHLQASKSARKPTVVDSFFLPSVARMRHLKSSACSVHHH